MGPEMQIKPDWLKDTYKHVTRILSDAGYEVYAVGGCVRDAVAGVPCHDVDIATNALPITVMSLFESKNIRVVPTGIDHGTVTVVMGAESYEITTYRKDVDTDGRRATVQYATTIMEDAKRRDFTMNALYMNKDGVVVDPIGTGINDLKKGIVRFVGDADERCKEDYLRVLRYFRFVSRFEKYDYDNNSCRAAVHHAKKIPDMVSGERIWDELKKIMSTDNWFDTIGYMAVLGVLDSINTPIALDGARILRNGEKASGVATGHLTRMALGLAPIENLPMAKAERVFMEKVRSAIGSTYPIESVCRIYGNEVAASVSVFKGMSGDFSPKKIMEKDITTTGITSDAYVADGYSGKSLGDVLAKARHIWYASGMQLTAKEVHEQATVL